VVLAVGNFPPGDPITSDRRFHLSRKYLSDPWSSSTLRRLAYAGDILILGHPVPNLHTLGSPQKGRLFETTAVPELRQQAFDLAGLIAEDLQKNARMAVEDLAAGTSSAFE
jgi:uncharacterized NAD(P)/FAD-binding protein YdhS